MAKFENAVKQPGKLSPRVKWLRDYYFQGRTRKWNNEYNAYTTGTPWDTQFDELTYYIVPENYSFLSTFVQSFKQISEVVEPDPGFWEKSLPERKADYTKKVVCEALPAEILPGDLLCGARFNMMYSMCLTEAQQKDRDARVAKARESMKTLYDHGYGNSGATSGHLVPGYAKILQRGFKGEYEYIEGLYNALPEADKQGKKGAQLRAMMTACTMPRDLAAKYSALCREKAATCADAARAEELRRMADICAKVPWEPATTFWEAVQSLWMTHMLVMSDEKYPGPGVSFGRIDQYLYPYYRRSIEDGMSEDFMKEILGCFWFHCNTAYDAVIRVGNQGITAGFGQLLTLSGMGPGGADMTNDLTYLILDVIDDMSPILEPKPNVRLHRGSPEALLDRVVDMISTSQGAPFLLNFDERSMAGMMREHPYYPDLINRDTVCEYAPVGCLENTMVGNDRSGTVDNNLNLLKALELVYANGRDMEPYTDAMGGAPTKLTQDGPVTGTLAELDTWEKFWEAYRTQTAYIVARMVDNYELSESIRADYNPTPYLSCLVGGCAEQGLDVTQGGAQISFVTMEGVTFATTVDSLLAVKYLVYDQKVCSLEELVRALRANWEGFEVLQAKAQYRAPKYGRDDDEADAMAEAVMRNWSQEVWKYRTKSTGRQFRPGMLSWNYWIGASYILRASANGRKCPQFLSNAICPSNGADINGPTSNANSVGKALGGKAADGGDGDFAGYINMLPNGASHTITFNTSLVRDPAHKEKFKSFIKGYIENGGTALQINILDPDMLRDAQAHPQDYRHLLVRITGYNAYFVTVGKELQDEIIARESHKGY